MSGDSVLPTIPSPSPPSHNAGEPQNDRYGSGGYFSGGVTPGKGGGGGGLTDPLPYFKITRRQGYYYWYVNFRYEPHWGEYSVCIYHTRTNADWQSLTDEEKQRVYDMAELVWEVANDTTKEKKYSEYYKSIDEKYQNGYYFARCKIKNKLGKPTVCQPFPSDNCFVVPDKIQDFQIEESPYYVNDYTNPISCLTIAYKPPKNMKGFWGVKLYIQGYHGDNEIRELTIKKYDKTKGEADYFNVYLEPDNVVQMENYIIGDNSESNYENIMYPVKRSMLANYIKASGVNTEEISIEMYRYYNYPRRWQAENPASSYYLNKATNIGDTIILTAGGSGANSYTTEAIIKDYDSTYPQRKAYCKLKNLPIFINPPDYQIGNIAPFLQWKIIKSCKFYLISINEYGYHGDLETEALFQYCALDGLESAPIPPISVEAFQGENQNIISFDYPSYDVTFNDVDSFNIYRYAIGGGDYWKKLVNIKAKSKGEEGSQVSVSEPYKYVDGDMASLESDGQSWNYDIYVMYGVTSVDKAGRESIIGVATHYLLDGTITDSIPFRRGTGVDHSPIVMVRGMVTNLLYNSEANWNYNYGLIVGYGNAYYNDWAIYDRYYAHPLRNITWDATNDRFYINFTSSSTIRNNWFKIITQQTDNPAENTTYFPTDTGFSALGRAKIIIPAVQYEATIYAIETNLTSGNYYLRLYVLPRFPSGYNVVLPASQYHLSIAAFTGDPEYSTITDVWRIDNDYPIFINGWLIYKSDMVIPSLQNGYLVIEPPATASGRCAYAQRIRKNLFYPGQAITASFWIAREKGAVTYNNMGVLGLSIEPSTTEIYNIGPDTSPSPPYWSDGAYIELNTIPQTLLGKPYNFEYVVLYGEVPDVANWNDIKYVRIALVALWAEDDVKYTYYITKPMINIGNEAAPYTPLNYVDRIKNFSPQPPSENPGNIPEDDPMCIEENQMIMMADGSYIMAKNLQLRAILKGYRYNNLVEKIERAKRKCVKIIFEDGNSMIVSTTHNCFIGDHPDFLKIIKANNLKIGDKMYNIEKDKMIAVKKILYTDKKQVMKISTGFPHHLIVNGILTHNIKAGGGEY